MGQKFYATSNPESQGPELAVHWDLDGWKRITMKNSEGRKVWSTCD